MLVILNSAPRCYKANLDSSVGARRCERDFNREKVVRAVAIHRKLQTALFVAGVDQCNLPLQRRLLAARAM